MSFSFLKDGTIFTLANGVRVVVQKRYEAFPGDCRNHCYFGYTGKCYGLGVIAKKHFLKADIKKYFSDNNNSFVSRREIYCPHKLDSHYCFWEIKGGV